jgi:hypothetical protein
VETWQGDGLQVVGEVLYRARSEAAASQSWRCGELRPRCRCTRPSSRPSADAAAELQHNAQAEQIKAQYEAQLEQARMRMQAEVDNNRQAAEAQQHALKVQQEASLQR